MDEAFAGHIHPDRTEYSILYRNMGRGKFKDVTEATGLKDGSWSGDAAATDINGDGWPDLYVLNMQGDDHLYINVQGKRFEEQTAKYFPKTPWGSMGLKFFDADGDGRLDLFIADMHSDMADNQTEGLKSKLGSSEERIKSEAWCSVQWTDAFLQGASNNIFGNGLYMNRGGGVFSEESDKRGAETYWPWGLSVGDLNADGLEDMFITAGMGHPFRYGYNSLLLNEQGRRFVDAEFVLGVEPRPNNRIEKVYFTLNCDAEDRDDIRCQNRKGLLDVWGFVSSRSSVLMDIDDDGDLDIITAEMHDRPLVLISDLTSKRKVSFVQLKLTGTRSNRDGLGAMVRVHAGGRIQTRSHDGKSGYLAMSSMPLYFGLGDATAIERIEVDWPSGRRQVINNVGAINRLMEIKEPAE